MAKLWRGNRLCQQPARDWTVTDRILHQSNRRQRLQELRKPDRNKIQRLPRSLRMGARQRGMTCPSIPSLQPISDQVSQARCQDPDCNGSQVLTTWADQMSQYIKTLDTNHLITFGGYGYFNDGPGSHSWDFNYDGASGEDFGAILDLPNIDFGTFHLYTDDNGYVTPPHSIPLRVFRRRYVAIITPPRPQSHRPGLRPPMDPRSQRRLRRRGETLRPGRARGESKQSQRPGCHEPVPELHPLQRSPSHPRQYGLVELLYRYRMSRSLGSICDMCFGPVLCTGCDGLCSGHGSQDAMTLMNQTTVSLW